MKIIYIDWESLMCICISQVEKMSFYFVLLCCLKEKIRWSSNLKKEYAKYSIWSIFMM